MLQTLPDDRREQFVSEYQKLLNEAYPAGSYGTVLPFRRIFVVARGNCIKPSGRDWLLITDPQANQATEVAHEPLALVFWVGHADRLGQHSVEVR